MREVKIKPWTAIGLLGAVFILSGCSQPTSVPAQSQSNSTSSTSKPVDAKADDVSMANKRLECIKTVLPQYKMNVNDECHKLNKEDNCKLPASSNLSIQKAFLDNMDGCYKNNPSKAKFQGEEDIQNTIERFKCLNNIDQYYIDQWDSQCSKVGKAKQCTLPMITANTLDNRRSSGRNECYNKFPEK